MNTLTEVHQIKKSHHLFNFCDEQSFKAKNLYNLALYNFRQSFIDEKVKTLTWPEINKQLKTHDDYKALPAKLSNAIIKKLGANITSFWGKAKKNKGKKITDKTFNKVKLPKYLHKTEGRFLLEFTNQAFRFKDGVITLSPKIFNVSFKTNVENPTSVRIVPFKNIYKIEVTYNINTPDYKENDNFAGIDLGVSNFATIVNNKGDRPLIISGLKLKSINQYYNKKIANLMKIKNYDKELLHRLHLKRSNKLSYEIHHITKFLSKHCDESNISKVIIGNNSSWKQNLNLGYKNNQTFQYLPYMVFINQLKYKCKNLGIEVVEIEESYTSKCSFYDNESVEKHEKYLGSRVKRGLFKTLLGKKINADVNGAYNILRKYKSNFIYSSNLKFSPIKLCNLQQTISI